MAQPNRYGMRGEVVAARNEQRRRSGEYGGQAAETRGAAVNRLMNFDARQYLDETTGAIFDREFEVRSAEETAHRTNLARRGVGLSDVGGARMRRDANERLARSVSAASLQAAQLDQANTSQIIAQQEIDVDRAESATNRELDLTLGLLDIEEAARQAEEERRRRKGSVLGGALGGLLGFGAGMLIPGAQPFAGTLAQVGARAGAGFGGG